MRANLAVRQYLVDLSRPSKQVAMVGIDVLAYLLCAACTGWLLLGDGFVLRDIYLVALITIVVAIPLGWVSGLYGTIMR